MKIEGQNLYFIFFQIQNPVYCVKVVDNKESHNLISISNDGKLCSWSLENLNVPVDTQELYLKTATNRNVYATCFDFQAAPAVNIQQASNEFSYVPKSYAKTKPLVVVGAEDGLVHTLAIKNKKFSPYEVFDDHLGPITGVSCFNQCDKIVNEYENSATSLSQLFLTSSFDSTIKLWTSMVIWIEITRLKFRKNYLTFS